MPEDKLEDFFKKLQSLVFETEGVPCGQRLASLVLVQRMLTDSMLNEMEKEDAQQSPSFL